MPPQLYPLFFFSAFIFFQLASSQATCYLPDGTVAYGDIPCGPSPSTCCAGQCLSNGLCFTQSDNLLARSSCTDQSWQDSACTSVCRGSNTGAFEPISPCGGGLFCCGVGLGSGADDCCSSNSGFTLGSGNLVADPLATVTITVTSTDTVTNTVTVISTSVESQTQVVTVTENGAVVTGGETIVTSTETVSKDVTVVSTVTIAEGTNNPSQTNSGVQTVVCSGVFGITGTPSNPSTALSSSHPSCTGKEVAIGAGVGVTLGVALLAALAALLWRKRPPFSQQAPIVPVPMSGPQQALTHIYSPNTVNVAPRTVPSPGPTQPTWQGNDGRFEIPNDGSPPLYGVGK